MTPDREKLRQLAEAFASNERGMTVTCHVTREWGRSLGAVLDEVERVEAERDALKAAKWDVKHVDTMNDMVAMGMARDAAIAERDALRAALVEAREALQPFALAIKDHIPDETLITNVAWDAGQHRRAASVHSRLSGEGE